MTKIALVEAKPNNNSYSEFAESFEFDRFQLCSDPSIKKVLKRDCDIEIDVDDYDWVILVGSEALKYFTKINSITEYSGKLVDSKFLPVINPAMLAFKPEATKTWTSSVDSINAYIRGEVENFDISHNGVIGIQDPEEALAFIREAYNSPNAYVALDSETAALYPRDGHMLGMSLSYAADVGAYIDMDCIEEEAEELLHSLFKDKKVIFHNAKFDIAFFEYHFGFEFPNFEDTMLLHYLIDENPGTHGLKQLAMRYTKYGDYEKGMYEWIADYCKTHGIKKADFTWDLIPFEVIYPYAAIDSIVTFLLFEKFEKIKQNKRLANVYDNILIPGTRFLIDAQDNGVPFDKQRLKLSQARLQESIDEAIAKLYEDDRIREFEEKQGKQFNPNSVIQLRSLLFDYLGLNPTGKKTGTGKDSTDAEVLEQLSSESEVPELILNIRRKTKIKNTYIDKIIPQLDRDSRLRTNFNLHSTTSGRLSSSGKLNMQQLPRDEPTVKGCIKANPGYKIVAMDLTTAEVYVAAVLAEDENLKQVFRSGGDFHGTIAHKVFNLPCEIEEVKEKYPLERQAAKAVSFGIMYGAQARKISDEVTKASGVFFSVTEAQEVIDQYFKEFYKLKEWLEKSKKFIEQNGFIYSFFGRKRRLANVMSTDNAIRSHNIRSGLNFLVQSTASDINLLGAIDMNAYIKSVGMDAKIFALVHDSILAEVKEEQVEEYTKALVSFVQMDRGLSIPGAPVGCDVDVADDYSLGKYEKKYLQAA